MRGNTAAGSSSADNLSLQSMFLQFGVMFALFYCWSNPVIQPLKVVVVLFHEMSHGLMAILTGGDVIRIEVNWDEGGACETEGGLPLFIVSAGYIGSMLAGCAILYLSGIRDYVRFVYGMLAFLIGAAVLTVLAPECRMFGVALIGALLLGGLVLPLVLSALGLRVLGTVCCLYSIFDIYWDVLADRGTHAMQNDAVVFSNLSGANPQSVGLTWLVVCLIFFLFVLRQSLLIPPEERAVPQEAKA